MLTGSAQPAAMAAWRDTKILCPDGPGRMLFHRSARYSGTESNTHTHTQMEMKPQRPSQSYSFNSSLESGVCSLVCIARISRIRISMLLFVVSSSSSSSSALHVFVTRFCILRLVSVALKFMQHHGSASPSTSLCLTSPSLPISFSPSVSLLLCPSTFCSNQNVLRVCLLPCQGSIEILTKLANRQSVATLTETFSLVPLRLQPNLRVFN